MKGTFITQHISTTEHILIVVLADILRGAHKEEEQHHMKQYDKLDDVEKEEEEAEGKTMKA